MIESLRALAGIGLLLALLATAAGAAEPVPEPVSDPPPSEAVPVAPPDLPGITEAVDPAEVIEPDLADLPVSNAARVRLDRARDSVVQIRRFFGAAETSAFHGSGFAVNAEGMIVTNYHVVADAVLHPRQYRLEYVTADNRTGLLQVYAVDVRNDLAIVKAEGLELPPLRLRTLIPSQGARAYSIGFPLNLGLTITEGVANGLVATGFDQRIHYTGAINGGMSGGPALDAGGGVYGVNVSVIAGRQLVGFVVPARHIEPLLLQAKAPLDQTLSARQAREMVTAQALAHEAAVFNPGRQPMATQNVFGFQLPTRMSPAIECSTTGASESSQRLQTEIIGCAARAGLLVQRDLEVGSIRFQHRIVLAQNLHPVQFSQRVNRMAENYPRAGSAQHVAPYACRNALVSLDGFDARVTTCARQYRLFAGLYDIAVTVTSVNSTQRAVVSHLDLGGVGYEAGMLFVRRFLEGMRWMP